MRISTGDILAVELLIALFSMIYCLRDMRISFGEKRQQEGLKWDLDDGGGRL